MRFARSGRIVAIVMAFLVVLIVGGGVANAAPYGQNAPRLGVIDPGPCAGSYIDTQGSGFHAGETVLVSRDGISVGSVTASADGSFSDRIMLDKVAIGGHTVTATGQSTGVSASSPFTVTDSACDATTVTTATTVAAAPAAGSGSLAFTGAAVTGIGALALVALVGGLVLIVLGRRRA